MKLILLHLASLEAKREDCDAMEILANKFRHPRKMLSLFASALIVIYEVRGKHNRLLFREIDYHQFRNAYAIYRKVSPICITFSQLTYVFYGKRQGVGEY